jgi:hypothetical protein
MNLESGACGVNGSDEDTSKVLAGWLRDVGRRKWRVSRLPGMGGCAGGAESCEEVIEYLEQLAGRKIRSREDVRRCLGELWAKEREAGRIYRRRQIVKESLMLLCLVTAYIQYYFWDVNLQIARLPSTVIFVPTEATSASPRSTIAMTISSSRPIPG